MSELPPSLIETDLGRWYGLSYDGSGAKPQLRVHVYVENYARLEMWARTSRSSLFYECYLLSSALVGRSISIEHGDRYLRFVFTLEKAYPLERACNDLRLLLQLLRSVRDLEYAKMAHDSDRPQLIQLELAEPPRGFIGGILTPTMVQWLQTKKTAHLESVQKAIFEVRNVYAEFPYKYNPDSPYPYEHVELLFGKNGYFSFDCGGASCMVEEKKYKAGKGYTLTCQNVDSSLQQLALAAGLAALHQLAAKDLDRGPPDD